MQSGYKGHTNMIVNKGITGGYLTREQKRDAAEHVTADTALKIILKAFLGQVAMNTFIWSWSCSEDDFQDVVREKSLFPMEICVCLLRKF